MATSVIAQSVTAIFGLLLATACIDEKKVTETVGVSTSTPADFTVQNNQTEGQSSTTSSNSSSGSTTAGSTGNPDAPTNNDAGAASNSNSVPDVMAGILVNGGAARTNNSLVHVDFIFYTSEVEMKYGFTPDCRDGVYAAYEPKKDLVLPAANQSNVVSVQYRDYDGIQTKCYSQSIIHDNMGPNIQFQKFPMASQEEGSSSDLVINVTDAGSAVAAVSCSLNGIVKPCAAGLNSISISAMPVGSYQFSVSAEDELGNKSDGSVKWEVVSTTRHLTQDFNVNDYRRVDVLFVIDNSGSMAYEQQSMAKRTSNFLSLLSGLDWQVGITTTDPNNIPLGDGRLIPITGGSQGQVMIDSRQSASVAQSQLSQTLQRKETGSGSEQGIRAVYRAVERYNANESAHRQLIRDGAQLAVVLISDEDESANTVKNDPQALVNLIHDSFQGNKRFSYHSIVTKTGDKQCLSTYGATVGARYELMSKLTGGLIGSVCEMDYATQVQGVAQEIRNLLKTLSLKCAPLPQFGVKIQKDGVDWTPGNYVVNGLNMVFDKELEPGNYSVSYQCLK